MPAYGHANKTMQPSKMLWYMNQSAEFNQRFSSRRLQAQKSSFQAWKTISFGCSLLALFLITCKWREVSNDLRMLAGIEQLLEQQQHQHHQQVNHSSPSPVVEQPLSGRLFSMDTSISNNNNQNQNLEDKHLLAPPTVISLAETLSLLKPIKLEPHANSSLDSPILNNTQSSQNISQAAESASKVDKKLDLNPNDSDSIIRDQIHLFLSQEFNAHQLLRLEIELFSAEFRSSRSTLLLSLILVAIYIVSWMLITLAIKDTRISNDISVRNILLLCIFGAIDIASSVAFILVRLVMYSIKNNPFATDLLQAVGLKDSPIKLNADQTTAFAALRLIAMRSSAANIDLFVGSLVALVTILRLYAIARGVIYYRRLKRFGNRETNHPLSLPATATTSASTSRRSSAATTLNEPLGLQMPHQFQAMGEYPLQAATHSKSAYLWSPPARPSSYSVAHQNQHQHQHQSHNNTTTSEQNNCTQSSYNKLDNVYLQTLPTTSSYINCKSANLISENPIGPSSDITRDNYTISRGRPQAKFVLVPNHQVNGSEQQHTSRSMSDMFACRTAESEPVNQFDAKTVFVNQLSNSEQRRPRRHASVETIRAAPSSSDLLLVQATQARYSNHQDKGSVAQQQQARHLSASRRQRASSSPRLLVSVNPDGKANDSNANINFNPNCNKREFNSSSLSAHNLLKLHQQHQLENCDSEPIANSSGNKPPKKSRKSVPSFQIYQHQSQESRVQPNLKLLGEPPGQRSGHMLTRSSLQDLIVKTNYHHQVESEKKLAKEQSASGQVITSPIKAFRTLRNKTSERGGVVPTLYTLFNPAVLAGDKNNNHSKSSKEQQQQPHQQQELHNVAPGNSSGHQLANSANRQATKYKLVARYRQIGSLDSSAATRVSTTTDNSASSSSSSSSSTCGPDDSDGSLATNELLVANKKPEYNLHKQLIHEQDGMRQSDEFVTCSSGPGIAIAHSMGGAASLLKQAPNGSIIATMHNQSASQAKRKNKGSRQQQQQLQQQTIVMSAQDDLESGSSDNDATTRHDDDKNILASENILMGKYYYYT